MKLVFVTALLLGASINSIVHACNSLITSTTPNSRFELFDDEVKDLKTGLIWQRCSVGQEWSGTKCIYAAEYTWVEALTRSLALATADKLWRLPNIKELASIVERSCRNPAINQAIFPETMNEIYGRYGENSAYWSSSPSGSSAADAWAIYFFDGSASPRIKSNHAFVLLVRDAE